MPIHEDDFEPLVRHERIRGDGVELHVAVAGEGPAVILLRRPAGGESTPRHS